MTIEGSKEWLCEMNGEEEKKALQDLVRNLERMLIEQNKYITMLIGEHNGQTLKRRWTPRGGNSWDGQTVGANDGSTRAWYQSRGPIGFLLDQAWDRFVQVICFIKKNRSHVTFWINESWPCWKSLVLSFSLLHLHHAYLYLRNACTHPHVSC